VKEYRLSCPDPKSPKSVISRYIRKVSVVNITEEESKQVDLERKVKERVQESTRVEPVKDAQGSTSGDDALQEEQCNIATRRARRPIRPPK